MKLDNRTLQALNRAVRHCGSAAALAAQTGVDPGCISRYLRGRVKSISDDNTRKLKRFLDRDMVPAACAPGRVMEWKEVGNDPALLLGNRESEVALRVEDVQMAPRICARDIIVVRPAESLEKIPENRIVVALCREKGLARCRLLCRRLRNLGGRLWFFSDDPEGCFFPAESVQVMWSGVVLRKICEL